jgi:hypothetical protein
VTEVQQPTAISVMLIVSDAEAAVAWYKGALGATELWNLGGVAGLEIEGAPFFLHQVNPNNPAETALTGSASRARGLSCFSMILTASESARSLRARALDRRSKIISNCGARTARAASATPSATTGRLVIARP